MAITLFGGIRKTVKLKGAEPPAVPPPRFRGQAAGELFVILMAMLVVFIFYIGIFAQDSASELRAKMYQMGVNKAEEFAEEINIAARAGDGYYRNYSFSEHIPSSNYSIVLNTRSGTVDIYFSISGEPYSYSARLITRNVRGEVYNENLRGYGINVSKKFIAIRNVRGIINVTQ